MKVWIIVMCKLKFCGTKWIMFENTKEVFCTMWSDSISQYLGMIFFSVSQFYFIITIKIAIIILMRKLS